MLNRRQRAIKLKDSGLPEICQELKRRGFPFIILCLDDDPVWDGIEIYDYSYEDAAAMMQRCAEYCLLHEEQVDKEIKEFCRNSNFCPEE